ncbi:peptide chain release factor N(5)-glutamine methyltransferase [Candidatus Babeliales bacterium]|nr:peptide chain release factor N(5)-glutamine methyltransferase [Candidatus Babeliales bacterium]
MKKKVGELIILMTKTLLECCRNKKEAQSEGWWLLEKLTEKKQAELIGHEEVELSSDQEQTLATWLVQRTKEHKPLQYILGFAPFCGLEILVKPPILIPRPETEEWCSWLIKRLNPVRHEQLKILDIGAGSGCIALTLAQALPNTDVIGVDIHPDALKLCEKNKTHNKIENVTFLESDLYEAFKETGQKFDLIVSNPPYISEPEFVTLSKDVTKWEDKSALVANEDGYAMHRRIIQDAIGHLKQDSLLKEHDLPQIVIEIGKGQEDKVKDLLEQAGFCNSKVYKDLEGVNRWVTGNLK